MTFTEEEIKKMKENPEYENYMKIVDESDTFEEAVEKLSEKYEGFDAEKFREICENQGELLEKEGEDDSEEVFDLDEDDLEAVAGGGIGSWFKKNWKKVVGAALGGVAGYAIGDMLSMKQKKQSIEGGAEDSGSRYSEENKTRNGNII